MGWCCACLMNTGIDMGTEKERAAIEADRKRRGEPNSKEITLRIYHHADGYKDYLSARFYPSTGRSRVSFEWEGHRWAYRHTHFDDQGDYDLIYRPAPQPVEPSRGEPVTLEAERLAANRYRPVPDGVFAYKVVAGDGSRSLFSGSKDECYVVARKLTEAFLDGAFAATNAAPQPAEPVNEEELLAAREALIDMGYLWDGDQWVEVDPPSKTVEQAPEWPDFALMEASLQRLKERLVFENGRRKDLEQRLREKRNG